MMVWVQYPFFFSLEFKMLDRKATDYNVYLMKGHEKLFIASILTDSPHKARNIVWNKFEPEIKRKSPDAKVNHLHIEVPDDQVMVK